MSDEKFKGFWAAIQADPDLQKKLNGVSDHDSLIKIAKDAGFVLTVDEIRSVQEGLSDEELAGVAGGGNSGKSSPPWYFYCCVCE